MVRQVSPRDGPASANRGVCTFSDLVSWRIPLGESGLLDFFLDVLAVKGAKQPLKKHALRMIGNSCADTGTVQISRRNPQIDVGLMARTDENRARVVESGSLGSIIGLLADDSVVLFVLPVLYNILVDYGACSVPAVRDLLTCLRTRPSTGQPASYEQSTRRHDLGPEAVAVRGLSGFDLEDAGSTRCAGHVNHPSAFHPRV